MLAEQILSYSSAVLNRLKMLISQVLDEDRRLLGAVDYYFIEEDGARCKHSLHSAYIPSFFSFFN